MSAVYSFRERWHLAAAPAAVREVLVDLERYPDWWPQVRAVAKLSDVDAWVLCRSALPYTLDLVLHAVHREPHLLETRISGDLDGVVRFRLDREAAGTRLDFEQDVIIRGLLGRMSPVLRPVFVWNHARMMADCRAGLARRLRAS